MMKENNVFLKVTVALVIFSVIVSSRTLILVWNIFSNGKRGPSITNLTLNTIVTVLEVSILFSITFFNKTLEVIDMLVTVYIDKYYQMN
jgi:hypothetical protein